VAAFAVGGTIWIVFSDLLLALIIKDAAALHILQSTKGVIFVAACSLLLFFLIKADIIRARSSDVPSDMRRPTALFLLLAGFILTGISLFQYKAARTQIAERKEFLSTISRLQIVYLERLIQSYLDNGSILERSVPFKTSWNSWVRSGFVDSPEKDLLLKRISNFRTGSEMTHALLLDSSGALRLCEPTCPYMEPSSAEKAARSEHTFLSDFFILPDSGKSAFDLVIPLRTENEYTGSLILRLDPSLTILQKLEEWNTHFRTGETIFFRKDGNQLVFLNNLRTGFKPLQLKLIEGSEEKYLAELGAQKEGCYEAVDYRHESVAGCVYKVQHLNWYLGAKMDKSEIYEPNIADTLYLCGFAFILLLLSGGLFLFWWRERNRYFLGIEEREKNERLNLQRRFDYVSRYANDIIFVMDADFNILDANDRALQEYGYTIEEIRSMQPVEFRAPETRSEFNTMLEKVRSADSLVYESLHVRKDASVFPVEISSRRIDGPGTLFHFIVRDITERKSAQAQIERLNRLYTALSQTNRTIIHSTTKELLFNQACRIAVTYGGFVHSWIRIIDREKNVFIPVSQAGFEMNLDEIELSLDPDDSKGGICSVAFRENRPVISNALLDEPLIAPWKEQLKARGIVSGAYLPLYQNGKPTAIFGVYSSESDFFSDDLVELLIEMSEDISFALENIAREESSLKTLEELELVSEAFQKSSDSIFITDSENNILRVNRSFTRITGYKEAEVIGKNPRFLKSGKQSTEFYKSMWAELLQTGKFHGEFWNKKKDGTHFLVRISLTAIKNASGEIKRFLAIATDITDTRKAEERIQHLAHFHPLTDLPNRELLASRIDLTVIMSKMDKAPMAVICVNLDRFKTLNDAFGHPFGDVVLKTLSASYRESFNDKVIIAHPGSDEFFLVIPDCPPDEATRQAVILQKITGQPRKIQGRDLRMSASIGIAVFPVHGEDSASLIRNAEAAMAEAKLAGGNNHQIYRKEMTVSAIEKTSMENELRQAIEAGEIQLHYQPQMEISSGRIIGMEALARWTHPGRGVISPGQFIPLAEETGLIGPLGELILEKACLENLSLIQEGFPGFPVAVNISAHQFRQKKIKDIVMNTLNRTGLAPDKLELEVTESSMMTDTGYVIGILQELKDMNVQLSIDDFGTGYSSLNYLSRFSVDKLKIDQSFTRGIGARKDEEHIVKAVINLGKNLNLKVIAEGVETAEQLNFLRENGCDEIQGYYFSRPLPPAELRQFLRKTADSVDLI